MYPESQRMFLGGPIGPNDAVLALIAPTAGEPLSAPQRPTRRGDSNFTYRPFPQQPRPLIWPFNVFNKLGNLLFAQANPQCANSMTGFGTVLVQPARQQRGGSSPSRG